MGLVLKYESHPAELVGSFEPYTKSIKTLWLHILGIGLV